ncbi:thioredoxin-dependent thiol peroxidase [candidate division WWE3 bacterium]|nr:thioredoxin-dependent thiol peroxidase [candidate division WWE3 bacterium]
MKAHDFSLPDQNGKIHKLSDYKGRWVVLYFYPKDDTPGCTKEACSFRDSWDILKKMGVIVLGISKDSAKSHSNFSKKFNLSFPILSDETHKIIETYGAWGEKIFMGKTSIGTLRKTFIISPEMAIMKVYEKVKPDGHAEEVIKDLAAGYKEDG